MSKSALVIDTPKKCSSCIYVGAFYDFCKINYPKAVMENQITQSIKQNEDKNIFNPIEKKIEEMQK